ncbi:ORFL39C [Human betaherpesvirus 5]|nr:ORFL39C [Human betaherpesvirus 5]QHX40331.1 ORFL39C [Human betaherpesvirus 5]
MGAHVGSHDLFTTLRFGNSHAQTVPFISYINKPRSSSSTWLRQRRQAD